MNRKAALTGAAIILGMLLPSLSHAAGPYTIKYPCGDPIITKMGLLPDGDCGKWINPVTQGTFTLTPLKPADLDIHFYDAANNPIEVVVGPPKTPLFPIPGGYACTGFTGKVPATAAKAIVVAYPSAFTATQPVPGLCMQNPAWAIDGSEMNIQFTYTTS